MIPRFGIIRILGQGNAEKAEPWDLISRFSKSLIMGPGSKLTSLRAESRLKFKSFSGEMDMSKHELDAWLLKNKKTILPLSLEELTPTVVGYFGLGAVAAAVMSSIDSSMLSGASMLTANVIQEIAKVKVKPIRIYYSLLIQFLRASR